MGIASIAQDTLQKRLPKVIDARTHGIIDYAHAAFFLGAAVLLRRNNPRAALACLATGTLVVGQSLLTDYPLGLEPVMSFEAHGKLDAAFAAASPFIPKLFGFSATGAANIFRANALVESAVVGLTDFDNGHAANSGGLSRGTLLQTRPGEIGQGRSAA